MTKYALTYFWLVNYKKIIFSVSFLTMLVVCHKIVIQAGEIMASWWSL